VAERAFPVIYAEDVERSVRFYEELGFEEHFRLPSDGEPGYVGLRPGDWELAIATVRSPEQLIGVEIGSKSRFEMFV
jgi:catechol 2,3-dioxygenase-like lactoylglutathione lyase family enzyme